ncbi:DUF4767 domain-containing protein [Lacticaseibacillus hegangensis]|uniref:DUF4767 domain-containing protein n=1 Tax=Lacticaseibacillus hegangensis TaxID=2486010 RepID=A0ABW4CUV1_9LACO|nr:DUF4767 domain-containing protein [Lacticaseibacillus hegangensis]
MKLWRTTILLTLGLALAACGNQQPKKAASSSSAVSSSISKKAKTGVKLAWNADKAQKLDAFMKDFGSTKSQTFTRADRSAHTKWQGLDLTQIYKAKRSITIDDTKTAVTWLPKKGQASKIRQNVVAVYADDQATVLFLFMLTAKGQTQVLISQSAPKGKTISTTETTNENVKKGFADIAAGRPAALTSKAIASSSSSAATSSKASPQKATHAAVFNASFQANTWYTNDNDSADTISFGANSITEAGSVMPVYWRSERTGTDKAWDEGTSTVEDQSKEGWGVADPQGAWVDIRGWYQSAGDGQSYRIVSQNLGGQNVPVLETAGGAGLWLNSNYYPTQELATQYQDTVFSDENSQD